jgi:hypothetical protein
VNVPAADRGAIRALGRPRAAVRGVAFCQTTAATGDCSRERTSGASQLQATPPTLLRRLTNSYRQLSSFSAAGCSARLPCRIHWLCMSQACIARALPRMSQRHFVATKVGIAASRVGTRAIEVARLFHQLRHRADNTRTRETQGIAGLAIT